MEPEFTPPAAINETDLDDLSTLMQATGIDVDDADLVLDGITSGDQPFEADGDEGAFETARQELQEAWGEDFEANMGRVLAYARDNLPDGLAERLTGARGKEGRALLASAPTLMRVFDLARRGAVVPPRTGDLDKDIAAIEKVMASDRDAYFRDLGLQARARALYAQRAARG